jgi:uncharacterized protein YbbC (DUF1343 family)
MRVGLIANQTSTVRGESLAVALAGADDVDLVAIFAPEHGFAGTAGAGEPVDDAVDPLLGIPVYSLYGATRAPVPDVLEGMDALVYDIQDVGARFYTYVSTMGLAMQAASAAGIEFFVLDRPDPQGAELAGFVRTPDQESFVSQYPIPASYAMTAGELARAIVGERWLAGLEGLDLTVIEMKGWDRLASWPPDLGWVAPSPALPSFESARAYPGVVLFEATSVSEGRGSESPFTLVGAPWIDGAALAEELDAAGLPGVRFEPTAFTPHRLPTMSSPPRFDGQELTGVKLVVDDPRSFRSVETGIHVLVAVERMAARAGSGSIIDRPDGFDLLAGTTELRRLLLAGASATEIIDAWGPGLADFSRIRERYVIY